MKKGKHYIVGYAGQAQTAIYTSGRSWNGGMDKMTFNQALKVAKTMPSKNATVCIFELTPFVIAKVKDLSKVDSKN
jgi:hypothetical protein